MTLTVEAPPRNLYDAGQWIVNRHPELEKLCHEVGAVDRGRVDLKQVRDAVVAYDRYHRDRVDWNRKNRISNVPESFSITLGPQPAPACARMLVMHPTQVAWLRLLATMAPAEALGPGVEWCVDTLAVLGSGSASLLRDWVDAVGRFAA